MSEQRNNMRHWKGLQLGYDEIIVEPADTSKSLYCLSAPQVEALLGLLEPIGWTTRWISMSDSPIDQVTILQFRNELERKLMSDDCCCGGDSITTIIERRITINDNGTIIVEISIDGGDTWTPDPDNPSLTVYQLPPVEETESSKCDAAANGVQHVEDYVAQVSGNFGTATTVLEFIAVVALAMIAAILAPYSAPIWVPILISVAPAVFSLGQAAWDAYWTSDVYDLVLCAFYCNLEDDGTFTEEGYATFLASVGTDLPAGPARDMFYRQMQFVGLLGAQNMCLYGGESGDCSDCDCSEGCNVSEWHIYGSVPGEGADVYGTEISRDSTSITASSAAVGGSNYLILWTADPAKCCVAHPIEVISGSPTGEGCWIPCGGDFPVNCSAMGDSRCIYLYQAAGGAPFTLKVTFQSCAP